MNLNEVREVILTSENVNKNWNNKQKAFLKAGKATLKPENTSTKQKWMTSEIVAPMEERRKSKQRNELKYIELQRKIRIKIMEDKEK